MDLRGFNGDLMGFTGIYWDLTGFHGNLMRFHRVSWGFVGFDGINWDLVS